MSESADQREKLLCQLLREKLEESEISQRQLAKKLSKSQSYVYKILFNKRKITVVEFLDWCSACEIPWHSLLEKVATLPKSDISKTRGS